MLLNTSPLSAEPPRQVWEPAIHIYPDVRLSPRSRLRPQDLVHDRQWHTKGAGNRHRLHAGMVRGFDQAHPSRRNGSSRIAVPVPTSRCACRLRHGRFSRNRTSAVPTAALKLGFDVDPQRLEIVVAEKLQRLRKVLWQHNFGSIRQTAGQRGFVFVWRRRLDICGCSQG